MFLIRCSDRYSLDFFDLCLWLSSDNHIICHWLSNRIWMGSNCQRFFNYYNIIWEIPFLSLSLCCHFFWKCLISFFLLCKNLLTLIRNTHFINVFCITEKMILGIFKKNGSMGQKHEFWPKVFCLKMTSQCFQWNFSRSIHISMYL